MMASVKQQTEVQREASELGRKLGVDARVAQDKVHPYRQLYCNDELNSLFKDLGSDLAS